MDYRTLHKIFCKPNIPRQMEFVSADENFIILEASQGAIRFVEDGGEEIIGQDLRWAFPELIGLEEVLINLLDQVNQDQDFYEIKAIQRATILAMPSYFDLYILGDFDEKTKKKLFILLLEDVTQQMMKEQIITQKVNECNLLLSALWESKSYLSQVISSIANPLILTNSHGKIKQLNRAAEDLFGYTESQLLGEHISVIFAEGQSIGHFLNVHSDTQEIELICLKNNQEKITVSFSRSVFDHEGDQIQTFVYIGRNVTQDKVLEKFWQDNEQSYRSLFTSMTEGAALHQLIDKVDDFLILDSNDAYSRIWELPREEIVGKLGSQVYGGVFAAYRAVFIQVGRGGKAVRFESWFEPPGKFLSVFVCCLLPGRFAIFLSEI